MKSDNLFHPKSYEHNIHLDSIIEPFQKRALKDQINEFGQTPKQIFYVQHPPRKSKAMISKEIQIINSNNSIFYKENAQTRMDFPEAKKEVVRFQIDKKGKFQVNDLSAFLFLRQSRKMVMIDEQLFKIFCVNEEIPTITLNLNSAGVCLVVEIKEHVFILGSKDGRISVFNSAFGMTTQSVLAHNNKVTSICFLESLV